MRLGIMAMQLNALIPPDLPIDHVFTHIAQFDHASLVRSLADKGFRLIELGGDLSIFLPHTFQQDAIDHLAALKAEKNLNFTVHLPLWSVEPSTPLTPVREGSVNAVIDTITATQPLEPECYVLHATGALAAEFNRMRISELAKSLLLRQFQASAQQSLESILNQTGINSRSLAIETIEFPLELTLELANQLDLSICFDTGHVLAGFSGNTDFFTALEMCLPRLGEVHLHDCPAFLKQGEIQYGNDHQSLGNGDLDTLRLLDRLEQAEFKGPIIFELQLEQALESLDYIQSIQGSY